MMKQHQPDWHSIAEKFDLWLPHIKPVADAMLTKIDLPNNANVLDVASGTGELAIVLARESAGAFNIVGCDVAEGMINVAKEKVRKEKLQSIRFEQMPAEELTFEAESFEQVICRFGVMLFDDPLAGMKEILRVLKPGGNFVLVVWAEPDAMPTMQWSYDAFKNHVPEAIVPPLKLATSLGKPEKMQTLLKQAKFANFTIERKIFNYRFADFDAYWNLIESSEILKQQFDIINDAEYAIIREEIAEKATTFMSGSELIIPHEYLLIDGKKD